MKNLEIWTVKQFSTYTPPPLPTQTCSSWMFLLIFDYQLAVHILRDILFLVFREGLAHFYVFVK